jgi:hypothetical protein
MATKMYTIDKAFEKCFGLYGWITAYQFPEVVTGKQKTQEGIGPIIAIVLVQQIKDLALFAAILRPIFFDDSLY